ncbi:Hypothetical protein PHPALM_538 [Phytophthora palmivora]|uniref:SWIM-type domain-containing protein n=1 Tax=Phytophthora palmivora TaxID=4796 RepID=A0A2P4YUN7_9STRA|nr:Hypothetical protein PHPALM_538 [Phytophthora palmivora]
MKNVYEAIRRFPSCVTASIVHDIESSYLRLRGCVVANWLDDPAQHTFAQCMWSQWLTGRFSAWQLYLTPSGLASTNNPAETINTLPKRDYTLRGRIKMGALVKELRNCCEDQSSNSRPFHFNVVPTKALTRLVSELVREKLLGTFEGVRSENLCGGQIQVYSLPAKRIVVAPNKQSGVGIVVPAQMGANYARMEVEGQSWGGWLVDVNRRWCKCSYSDAFGICIHVLFAIKSCDHHV